LHVTPQFSGRAGAEISLRDLVRATHDSEIRHGIAVLKPEPNDFTSVDEVGVPRFAPGKPLSRIGAVGHVRGAVSALAPDLVHTSLFEADLAGRVAARIEGVPVVTSLVNTTYAPLAQTTEPVPAIKRRLARGVDGLLARRATTAFHAISAAVADDAVAALGVPRKRIHVVPRGRSRATLGRWSVERRARARETLGLAPDRPVVVNVARQEPQKGQRHLLDAVAAVRRSHPDVVLLMVGREGRDTPELRRAAARLGIEEAVWWLGVRHDVSDVLCAADVFAFPSLWEGLGGAVLEAMALRVPVVASDIPALREVLAGGRAGALVPAGDASALAEQITAGLAGGPEVAAKVERAEQRFDETYELAAVAQQMCRLYERVLAGS